MDYINAVWSWIYALVYVAIINSYPADRVNTTYRLIVKIQKRNFF